jgi:hypothetical protein
MEGKDDGAGAPEEWPPGVPLSVQANASERRHSTRFASLQSFEAEHRLDSFDNIRRRAQRKGRRGWYGCNSAVFQATVRAADGTAGEVGDAEGDTPLVAMKVVYKST